ESGALDIKKEWHPLEEVVGAALHRLAPRLAGRRGATPGAAGLAPRAGGGRAGWGGRRDTDATTATSTTPRHPTPNPGAASAGAVTVEVADRGPGLPPGQETKVFEKFYRAEPGDGRGTGLGLAICHGIVRAHGGRIWAQNLPEGGVAFLFTIPITEAPPAVV